MNDVLDDTWSGIDVEIRKYSPSQPRDGRGRFTSGAAADDAAQRLDRAAETALQDAAPGVRVASRASARELAHLAISHLMDRAGQLASSARTAIVSTKVANVKPVNGGGLQVTTTHGLPPGRGAHIEAVLQIHPHHLQRSVHAQNVLRAVQRGLIRSGVPTVPMIHPGFSARFKNGPQP